jgi:hypothetical protein
VRARKPTIPYQALALAFSLITLLFAAGQPTASAASPAEEAKTSACEARAMELRAAAWVCFGGTLTYSDRGSATQTEVVDPAVHALSTGTAVTPLATQSEPSNYDTYCEYSGTCVGYRSAYIGWVKGNALYGDSKGGIGSFDVILRISLNGRQPQYFTKFYHDSGPPLSFSGTTINCREDNGVLPDSNCGNFGAFNGSSSYNLRTGDFNSKIIYGNRLNNSNDYYSTISGYFTPSGYPVFTLPTLRSPQFNCFGNDNCYFPGA